MLRRLLICLGLTATFAASAHAAETLSIPPIAFQQRTLANGLQVISIEDHTSPTVAVQVWYHVGSKDDPAGRSGFAHLFEHLMFKSTKHLKAEQFDRLTEDVGGHNNASTNDDFTNYFEAVPSNHLQRLLWAEAERMVNLTVNEDNFKSERAVVEEELRQRVLASPYGRLFNAVPKDAYLVHPYKRPGIGSIEDLEAASLDNVIAFHSTFYRPDYATLIVAGDFDRAELDRWVDAYFGPLAKPAAPIPHVSAVEPVTDALTRVSPSAVGMVSWRRCSSRSPVRASWGEVVGVTVMIARSSASFVTGCATDATPGWAARSEATRVTTAPGRGVPSVSSTTCSGPLVPGP